MQGMRDQSLVPNVTLREISLVETDVASLNGGHVILKTIAVFFFYLFILYK